MQKRQYQCPFEVVVRRPGNDDIALAAAWRFNSDETIRHEIAKELEGIEFLQNWRPINHNLLNAKKVRVHKMRRVQAIRAAETVSK